MLCMHSINPFDYCLYDAVSILFISCLLQNLCNALDVNSGPLSVIRTLGNPFLLKIEVSPIMIICVVVILCGTASGHLLAMSMYLRMNSQPLLHLGNGLTISTHTHSNGSYHFSLYHRFQYWFPLGQSLAFLTATTV